MQAGAGLKNVYASQLALMQKPIPINLLGRVLARDGLSGGGIELAKYIYILVCQNGF